MTCQLGAADANDRPVWRVTLRYPTSLPPAYPIRLIARLDQCQRPTVDYADEAIHVDLARGEGLLDMR
jgi:hypothetical protein